MSSYPPPDEDYAVYNPDAYPSTSPTTEVSLADGSAASPSLSFRSDPNTGLYHPAAANSIGFTTAGSNRATIDSTGLTVPLQSTSNNFRVSASGTSTTPAYSFSSDTSLGMYRVGSSSLGFSNASGLVLQISSVFVNFLQRILNIGGSASSPSYAFASDTDTGIYNPSANVLGISTSGTQRVGISDTQMTLIGDLYQAAAATNRLYQDISSATSSSLNYFKRSFVRVDFAGVSATPALQVGDTAASNRGFSFICNASGGAYSSLVSANDSLLVTTVKDNAAFNIVVWSDIACGIRFAVASTTSALMTISIGAIQFIMSDIASVKTCTLNTSIAVTGAVTSTNIVSGTWTPTLTGTANITGSTIACSQYSRNNDIVSFTVRGTLTCTNPSTVSSFTVTLPVARTAGNFTSANQANGMLNAYNGTTSDAGYGLSVSGGQTIEFSFVSLAAASDGFSLSGSYQLTN